MIWVGWILLQIAMYYFGIKWLNNRKIQQSIYSDSPVQHQKKIGTPTMGGVFIFLSFIFVIQLYHIAVI